jgi:ribosome-associated protein|tara:strand:+ start:1395 stop:1742 length:348 start_codon:yes stop_codon:yes gene_type:complete
MKVSEIKNNIEKILDNNKAKAIISIDLKKKSYIADYMIIASGTSSRHLQSLSENLVTELKKLGLNGCRIEGRDSPDWKLVDAHDVIIHLFHPEKREFYDLEKMWAEEIPKEKAII